jgi:tetratricopeptide (TPR) repeat protein
MFPMHDDLLAALADLDGVTLGRRLRDARVLAGMTQPDAGGSDVSAGYLSRIERGQRRPGPALVERLCDRIGVPVEAVVLGVTDEHVDTRAIEVELDFAELDLTTGNAASAAQRIADLGREHDLVRHPALQERARIVSAGAAAALGDLDGAIATFRDVLAGDPAVADRLRVSTALSRLLRISGDYDGAVEVAAQTLDTLPEGTGLSDELVRLRVTLAAAVFETGDAARALELCLRAVDEADVLSSPSARAAAYWNTALVEANVGNLDRALELSRGALVLMEQDEDARLLARLRVTMADLLLRAEPPQVDEAVAHLRTADREYATTSADPIERLSARTFLAQAQWIAGDADAAVRSCEELLEDARPYPASVANVCTLLGEIALDRDDLASARDRFVQAVHHLTSAGADQAAGKTWFELGALLDRAGLGEEAKDAYRRAAASAGMTSHLRRPSASPRVSR